MIKRKKQKVQEKQDLPVKRILPWQSNERGFLIILVIFALVALLYLFHMFLMEMVFSIILTCATYPMYKWILQKTDNKNISAFCSILIVLICIGLPTVYIIEEIGGTLNHFYNLHHEEISSITPVEINHYMDRLIIHLHLSSEHTSFITSKLHSLASPMFETSKKYALSFMGSAVNNILDFFVFFGICLFIMFFIYKDARFLITSIKIITPLNNYYDALLMTQIAYISAVLTVSVATVAILQGLSFGLLSAIIGQNWLFIGLAVTISAFIPVVGSLIIWLPLAIYLYAHGKVNSAIWVVCWGSIINGLFIDSFMRPIIIRKVYKLFGGGQDKDEFNPISNTLIVILSSMGGVVCFGVVGLFVGPILAAFAITILNVYVLRVKHAEYGRRIKTKSH